MNVFCRLALWLWFPFAVLFSCVIWPSLWVVKYGWVHSPFWHNVKAGWFQSVNICFKQPT